MLQTSLMKSVIYICWLNHLYDVNYLQQIMKELVMKKGILLGFLSILCFSVSSCGTNNESVKIGKYSNVVTATKFMESFNEKIAQPLVIFCKIW